MTTAQPIILHPRLTAIQKAAKENGDIFLLPRGWIFAHPDAVREILITHDAKFTKPRALRFARWTLGNGLLTSDGDLHRKQRPIIQPTLHPKKLSNYAHIMATHAQLAAQSWNNNQTIDAHQEMMRLTLHIVAQTLFSQTLGPEVDAISSAMSHNVKAFMRLTSRFGKIRAFLPTPFTFRYLFSRRKVLNVMHRFVANRRASNENKDDLLGRLLAAKTPEGQPAMSEQQLIDECVTLFAAGHETTANALTFTLYLIATHPEIQSKLHQEIDTILLDKNTLPTLEDVDRLPYLRMVLSESMRLYPPAWIQGREALEDLTIHNKKFKKGQTLFISQWLTHHDPRWWPDPQTFNPERFNPAQTPDRPRWSYFPFGGGSRSCIGEAFAWTEAILVLAVLTKNWIFHPSPNAPPIHLEPGITLRPATPVSLSIHTRTPKPNDDAGF